MPPFRVVVRYPEAGHPNHAWHAVGPVFDDLADLDEAVALAERVDPGAGPGPHPTEDRLRVAFADRLAEVRGLGYEEKAQELVVKSEGEDDAGNTVPVEHKWKDVA